MLIFIQPVNAFIAYDAELDTSFIIFRSVSDEMFFQSSSNSV